MPQSLSYAIKKAEFEESDSLAKSVLSDLQQNLKIAKEYDIVLCHENEKGIYGDIPERCLEIHQALPSLKAVFDPANFVQCGQDTLQAWEMLHPYIKYMHIKDALADGAVVPPGQGIGNVAALLAKYAAQGGKVLSLEPHLTKFVGLSGLEREGDTSEVGRIAFESKEAAFDFAARNLYEMVGKL